MSASRRTPNLQHQKRPPQMTPSPPTGLLTPLVSPELSRAPSPPAVETPRKRSRRGSSRKAKGPTKSSPGPTKSSPGPTKSSPGPTKSSPTGSALSAGPNATTHRRAIPAAGAERGPDNRRLPASPPVPDRGRFRTTALPSHARHAHAPQARHARRGRTPQALSRIRASDLDRELIRRLIRRLENGLLARQEEGARLAGRALYPVDKHNFRFMASWFQVWTVLAHMQTTDLCDDGETLHDSLLAAFTGALDEYESYMSLYYGQEQGFRDRARRYLSEMKYFVMTISGDPLGVPPHWPPLRWGNPPPLAPKSGDAAPATAPATAGATATATARELTLAQKWAEGAWHILTVRVLMPDTQDSRLWRLPEVVGGDPANVRWSGVCAALEKAAGGGLDVVPIPHLWRFNTENFIIPYNQAEQDGIIQDQPLHTGLDVVRWVAESILDDDGNSDSE